MINPDKLKQLFASSNVEDVNLALELISKNTWDENAEILGEDKNSMGDSWKGQIIIDIHIAFHRFGRRTVKQCMDYNVHFTHNQIKLCKRHGFKMEFPI